MKKRYKVGDDVKCRLCGNKFKLPKNGVSRRYCDKCRYNYAGRKKLLKRNRMKKTCKCGISSAIPTPEGRWKCRDCGLLKKQEKRFDKEFRTITSSNKMLEGLILRTPNQLKQHLANELARERERIIKMIIGELMKTQITADANRGDGTGNVDLTSVEYEAIFKRVIRKLKC